MDLLSKPWVRKIATAVGITVTVIFVVGVLIGLMLLTNASPTMH